MSKRSDSMRSYSSAYALLDTTRAAEELAVYPTLSATLIGVAKSLYAGAHSDVSGRKWKECATTTQKIKI